DEWANRADASIVDENVQSTQRSDGRFDKPCPLARNRDISGDHVDFAAALPDGRGQSIEPFLIAASDDDAHALFGKAQGKSMTDAAGSAGDNGTRAREVETSKDHPVILVACLILV